MDKNAEIYRLAKFTAPCGNNSGAVMLFVLVLAVILGIVIASVSFSSRYAIKKSGDRRVRVSALNIAEAGKERFYAAVLHEGLTIAPNSSANIYTNQQFADGNYTVSYSTGANADSMLLNVTGVDGRGTAKLEVLALKQRTIPITGMVARLPGAIIARGNVDLLGNINIDGRDYDSLNNMVGTGTYGVYTCLTMGLDKSSAAVGGNGIAPVDKKGIATYRSFVCRENAPIGPELASPEALLDLPAGSLDEYKIDPSDFKTPFTGLVYVTGNIGPVHFGESRGILIVHNATNTATLKTNQGNFKGLIICDVMDKINGKAEILGAVVTLSSLTTSTFGNGSADVHYSKQVLNNLSAYCDNVRWKIDQLSWRELP